MKLIFLGTNGWYDTELGSTPCVLLDAEKFYVVFDAGFGIYKLDRYITDSSKPVFLFISHLHVDHICGFHVLPKFKFKQRLTIFGALDVKKYLKIFLNHPFTASSRELALETKFVALKEGEHHAPFDFECRALEHADHTFGYRIALGGAVVTYCLDTAVCANDLLLARGADVLIHECSHLSGREGGWGHTNPEQAAELAKAAGVGKLMLTHFSASSYNAEKRREAEKIARVIFPNSFATYDGLEVDV